ncbi:class I fructose-bisphosphate aldolase [Arhodomonas sp. SL1]|uniref:class I fructose-bisphosphate aldolase n=1 Tax=Arhodomonas sp. SL1 TaxID=3425691 RepID=UPI003F8843BA
MTDYRELEDTIERMAAPGKGILAADESFGTIAKRLKAIDVESTEETRRTYRSLLVTADGIEEHIGGVIFFEETLGQRSDDGRTLPEICEAAGIAPGIKVDKGTLELVNAPGDKITQGLDGLPERLATYREQGARFTKWRNVYVIGAHNPTPLAVTANAEVMARYAALVQEAGMVPIVEPEVLMDGDHDVGRCAQVTEWVQRAVFDALYRYGVRLEHMVLKPNMVLPGKERERLTPEAVAEHTLRVLRRTVPAAVPAIAFLSGGQSPEEATANLNAINAAGGDKPWALTFSYGRALQEPAQQAWRGKAENIAAAQQAFLQRARLNGAARQGSYRADMEAA